MSAEAIQAAIDSLGNLDFPSPDERVADAQARARRGCRARADSSGGEPQGSVRHGSARSCCSRRSTTRAPPSSSARSSSNPNDRLRTVAYMYYEHHPTPGMIPALLKALEREESEFVRPGARARARRTGKRSARARDAARRSRDAARISSGARSSRRSATTARRMRWSRSWRLRA